MVTEKDFIIEETELVLDPILAETSENLGQVYANVDSIEQAKLKIAFRDMSYILSDTVKQDPRGKKLLGAYDKAQGKGGKKPLTEEEMKKLILDKIEFITKIIESRGKKYPYLDQLGEWADYLACIYHKLMLKAEYQFKQGNYLHKIVVNPVVDSDKGPRVKAWSYFLPMGCEEKDFNYDVIRQHIGDLKNSTRPKKYRNAKTSPVKKEAFNTVRVRNKY